MRTAILTCTIALCSIFLHSCYRAANPEDLSPLSYDLLYGPGSGYGAAAYMNANKVTLQETKYDSLYSYSLRFLVKAGDPAKFPMTCYVTGLPPDAKTFKDTFAFKLNADLRNNFTLKAGREIYTFTVNVFVAGQGLTSYPVQLKVSP